jgi:ligand-binding sensor domain-containing protein
VLCTYKGICAAKGIYIKEFTQEEGLPSNEAYYIFEDSRHYIWISTDLGVVRYNGNKFEQFSLPDNVVFKIKEDSKGRIWFFSHKALLAYFENEKIYPYKYNADILNRINKIHIIDCMIDSQDNILLNSYLDSNFVISPNGSIVASNHNIDGYQPLTFKINYISNNNCFTTMIHNGGSARIDTFLIGVKRQNKTIQYPVITSHYNFAHYGSTSADGHDIYFFAGNHLVRLKEDGTSSTKEMPGKILSLHTFQGNIWVGMFKNGAVLLSPDLEKKMTDTVLPNKSITSINTDYEGGLWFSTLENGAYYIKNMNLKRLMDIETSNNEVSRIMNLDDSTLIYAKSKGLYKYSNASIYPFFPYKDLFATDLFTDSEKSIYLFGTATQEFRVFKLNDPQLKSLRQYDSPSEHGLIGKDTFVLSTSTFVGLFKSNFFNTSFSSSLLSFDGGGSSEWKKILLTQAKLFTDRDGNIWAGTNSGLYKSTNRYDTLQKFKPTSALLNLGITSIRQMENGLLVTGIRSSGIALIKDTSIITNITEKEGLLSNKIRCLLTIGQQLWVATAKGISVIKFSSYAPLQYSITNIGKDDGFYNITIHQMIPFQKSIAVATSNGIYFIENPGEFLERKMPGIPFYITSVSYDKTDTVNIRSISVPYSKNRVLIKYTAVTFDAYENIKYLYRFDHDDSTWHTTTSRELLLENLESGSYTLEIKAAISNQNRYSAVQTLAITVQKPWWQNNWLKLLTVLLIAGATYLYVKNRIKKIRFEEKKKTELNAKLSELEQTALRSQMNPHFIFNCLTSIQQLIVSGNKTDANEYLVKFARLIRKILELSMHPFISIREEVEYLNEYLFLEQLRLSGHFEYKINTDKVTDIDKTYIPNMMIQPVVENCIRHGIKSLENRKGEIEIMFVKNETAITCTVTDNGIGRTDKSSFTENAFSKHKSYGMEIIRKRLQAYAEFNDQYSGIQIKDLYEANGLACGTRVTLQLPYKKNI